jgi:hypothetical protein
MNVLSPNWATKVREHYRLCKQLPLKMCVVYKGGVLITFKEKIEGL